jgi:hypothetical protein
MVSALSSTSSTKITLQDLIDAFESDTGCEFDEKLGENLCKDTAACYAKITAAAVKTKRVAYLFIGDKWSGKSELVHSLELEGVFLDTKVVLPFLSGYESDMKKMVDQEAYAKWRDIASAIARVLQRLLIDEGYPISIRWSHERIARYQLFEILAAAQYITKVFCLTNNRGLLPPLPKFFRFPLSNILVMQEGKDLQVARLSDSNLPGIFRKYKSNMGEIQFYHDKGSGPKLGAIWTPGKFSINDTDLYADIRERYAAICDKGSLGSNFECDIWDLLPIEGSASH